MLTERLRNRCPSAQPIGIAIANGYGLEFVKRSMDHSGKATLIKEDGPGRQAYGVLYEIENEDLADLDKAEGKGSGYNRIDDFRVKLFADGKQVQAKTYIASPEAIDTGLKPYDWYQALVIQGAVQNKLAEEYIDSLCNFTSIIDPKPDRKTRKKAIEALVRAGVKDFTQILKGTTEMKKPAL